MRVFFRAFLLLTALTLALIPEARPQAATMVSLLEEYNAATQDTARVILLNRIAAKHFELNQPEKARVAAQDALELAHTAHYPAGEAAALENLARYRDVKNQYGLAVGGYQVALERYSALADTLNMARTLSSLGTVYRYMGSFDSALFHFHQAREMLELKGETLELANTMNMIGMVYKSWGDHEASLEHFTASLKLHQSIGNSLGMSVSYCYIGNVYAELEEYSQAENYLNIALELNRKYGPTRDITDIYLELGSLYRRLGRNTESITTYEKGLGLARYYNNQRKVAEGFNDIGLVYLDLGDYARALNFFERARDINRELGSTYGTMVSSQNIAAVYIGILEMRNKGVETDHGIAVPPRAAILSQLAEALRSAKQLGNTIDQVQAYDALVRASAAFMDYRAAVSYQDTLLQIRDSIEGVNQNRSLAELQTRFERGQQEQEIELLMSQQKLQETRMRRQQIERGVYIGSGLSLVLLIIGLWNRMSFINRTRKELEEKNKQIAEEKRKAEQSEKVKEQFLSKMSHEIRIPMNTIMGGVNIIDKKEHLPEQKKYLNAIRQSSENLLVIIDDILDLTSLETGKVRLETVPFSIARVLTNIEEILTFKAREKEIDLQMEVADGLPATVIGDATRLNQILLNLAGNAIKFTEKGGVTIAVHAMERPGDQVTVRFEVTDTGIGIPADRQDKIFSSFTQADSETTRKYGGTGLGLTISKQLVEMQGGTIGVESEPGRGSTFYFEIPYAVHKGPEEEGGPIRIARSDIMKDLKILVVEDDEFNVMVLLDTLTSVLEGVKLEVAGNGREAYDKWAANEYDIILMDIELPDMNGHEVTRAIRRSGRMGNGVPIIAMTANALPQDMEACFNAGMNDFVPKPFDQDDLVSKINRLMVHQQLTQQP